MNKHIIIIIIRSNDIIKYISLSEGRLQWDRRNLCFGSDYIKEKHSNYFLFSLSLSLNPDKRTPFSLPTLALTCILSFSLCMTTDKLQWQFNKWHMTGY